MEKAAELGCGALCFERNIDFYGKSGFKQASEYGIRYHGLPEGEDASFFLCKELVPGYLNGITGEYATPERLVLRFYGKWQQLHLIIVVKSVN